MWAWGFVLTSGNWATRPLRLLICCPTLTRPLIVYRDPNGSPHLTWGLGTGRLRWMRRASHWLHLLQGLWVFMSVIRCPFDWLTPCNLSAVDGDLSQRPQPQLVYHLLRWYSHFSKDLASHLERLEAVFQRLEQPGLKLKPSKCELFQWLS